jgi:ABC-type antimicrobial peptide transport system permease subunit
MAIGASRGAILGMVLKDSALLVVGGLVIGLPLALSASRLASSRLFGIGVGDPVTMLVTSAVLAAVSLAAAYLPAWRAVHIDPLRALRSE